MGKIVVEKSPKKRKCWKNRSISNTTSTSSEHNHEYVWNGKKQDFQISL